MASEKDHGKKSEALGGGRMTLLDGMMGDGKSDLEILMGYNKNVNSYMDVYINGFKWEFE